jgi:hypothetical protein
MKMAKQTPAPVIEETTQYENLLGIKQTDNKPKSLLDHMDLDEEEKEKYSEVDEKEWKKLWKGMPEFDQEDNPTYKTIYVHFRNEEDYKEFAKIVGQTLTDKTKSIWHPKLDITKNSLMRWIEEWKD